MITEKLPWTIKDNKIRYHDHDDLYSTWTEKDLEKAIKSKRSALYLKLKSDGNSDEDLTGTLVKMQTHLRAAIIKGHVQRDTPVSPDKLPAAPSFQSLLDEFYGDRRLLEVCGIVVTNIPNHDPLWLLPILPPSSYKTTVCRMVNVKGYSHRLSTMTANSFSPGAAKIEDIDTTFSLLDTVAGNTLIIDDMSAILGQDPRVREKILGEMTTMYGESFSKFSPGIGIKKSGDPWNLIAGIVPHLYNSHVETMSKFGQRYLIYLGNAPDDFPNVSEDWIDNWRLRFNRILVDARERLPSITILEEDLDEMKKVAKQIAFIRSWQDNQVEGPTRLLNQCKNFCTARAALHARDVEEDDIALFARLALNTVPLFGILDALSKDFGVKLNVMEIAAHVNLDYRTLFIPLARMVLKKILVKCDDGTYTLDTTIDVLQWLCQDFEHHLEQKSCVPAEDIIYTEEEEAWEDPARLPKREVKNHE